MLTKLHIKNFALIDELEVSFSNGLSIITGETGAGKSIILGGLNLILGKRADLSSIGSLDMKCVVEATFNIENYKLKKLFQKSEIDYEVHTIIRREILPSGKSRAFINDTPVSLKVVKDISTQLIDIHSQHETLTLTNDDFQFEVIDALAKNSKLLVSYTKEHVAYVAAKKELEKLIQFQLESNETQDYNTFLLEELLSLKLERINQSELEKELEQLNNVEFIQTQLLSVHQQLSEEQYGVLTTLIALKNNLKNISTFSEQYNNLFERVNSVHIDLEDVFTEIEREQELVEANPERLLEITDLVNKLQNVQQKHQVNDISELLIIQDDLDEKVNAVANLDSNISKQENVVEQFKITTANIANQIHESRVEAIPKLAKQLEKILVNLGMENAKFNISVMQHDAFYENGNDQLSFLFSANKGGSFNELKKAASGGELSRIMLSIKAILSKHKQLPTIMFDEIDTGVSGDVANKMGLLMQYMSENMQVFSITHLPQIASKGVAHFKVYKEIIGDKTESNLRLLNTDERIQEIAEMLGGKDLSDTAIEHAKELLKI